MSNFIIEKFPKMSKAMEEDIGFFAVKSLMKLRFYNFSVSSF